MNENACRLDSPGWCYEHDQAVENCLHFFRLSRKLQHDIVSLQKERIETLEGQLGHAADLCGQAKDVLVKSEEALDLERAKVTYEQAENDALHVENYLLRELLKAVL